MLTSILNVFMFYFLLSISAVHTPYIPRFKGSPYAKRDTEMKGPEGEMKGAVKSANYGKLKDRMRKMKAARRGGNGKVLQPPMNKEDVIGMMDNPIITEIMKNPEMMINMMPEGGERDEFRKMLENPLMKSMMSNPELMKGMMSMAGV